MANATVGEHCRIFSSASHWACLLGRQCDPGSHEARRAPPPRLRHRRTVWGGRGGASECLTFAPSIGSETKTVRRSGAYWSRFGAYRSLPLPLSCACDRMCARCARCIPKSTHCGPARGVRCTPKSDIASVVCLRSRVRTLCPVHTGVNSLWACAMRSVHTEVTPGGRARLCVRCIPKFGRSVHTDATPVRCLRIRSVHTEIASVWYRMLQVYQCRFYFLWANCHTSAPMFGAYRGLCPPPLRSHVTKHCHVSHNRSFGAYHGVPPVSESTHCFLVVAACFRCIPKTDEWPTRPRLRGP